MSTTGTSRATGAIRTIGDLVDAGMKVGADLLETVGSVRLSGFETLPTALSTLSPTQRCGCAIPPPCWVPRQLGEVTSHVCPGGTATLRIRVTNCGVSQRTIAAEAAPKETGVSVAPGKLALGPMERGVFVASRSALATAATGEEHEALLWVHGCHDHVLRWTVKVARRGTDCCHEIDVDDCPDLVHHWYDHFYCEHPCTHGRG